MKICLVGAELFHVVRRTNMMKLITTFHNYTNTPKLDILFLKSVWWFTIWELADKICLIMAN